MVILRKNTSLLPRGLNVSQSETGLYCHHEQSGITVILSEQSDTTVILSERSNTTVILSERSDTTVILSERSES